MSDLASFCPFSEAFSCSTSCFSPTLCFGHVDLCTLGMWDHLSYTSHFSSALSSILDLLSHFASLVTQVVKNPPANAGDVGSIPRLRRSPEVGNDNPFQYSCLENPRTGAWLATGHEVAEESDMIERLNNNKTTHFSPFGHSSLSLKMVFLRL